MRKGTVCVDLFCGCGGLTRGLRDAGIDVVKGIDIDETAKRTYEENNPGSAFLHASVMDISADDLIGDIQRDGRSLLLAGCAPCQPFSKLATDSGRDSRRSLIRRMGDLVDEVLPEYVLVENVPKFGDDSNAHRVHFIHVLKKNGYCVDEDVVNVADYGVPQRRRRYILLASKNGKIRIPKATHKKERHLTVRWAIAKFPKIQAGENLREIPNHTAPTLSKKNIERIGQMRNDGDSIRDIPTHMWPECRRNHDGHTDTYGRMHWDKPAPTLTCRCISLSNGRFGHPRQNRAISVREAAALQTFPDDYVFHSYKTADARHIGNAVPVLFAKKIGQAITKACRVTS